MSLTLRATSRSDTASSTSPPDSPSVGASHADRPAPNFDRFPDAPSYAAFLGSIGRRTETEISGRLDRFRASFGGPYSVDGKSVAARPMFRMNGGANDASQRAHDAELRRICAKASVPVRAMFNATVGRPTPDQLRLVTQALLGAGKLPNGSEGLEFRIRQMQWEWGIGVDCAGYTEQAARAARGVAPQAPTHGDAFSGLLHDRTMQRVGVAQTRPGDVIHLDRPSAGDVGHNVIVYAHRVASIDERTRLAPHGDPTVETFFAGGGPFHVLEVDSSWGAGPNGDDYGGFRRDTWVYDETSSGWLYFQNTTKTFAISEVGPCAEPYVGAFRSKNE